MQTAGPRSVAAVQCVSGSLIPSTASSQRLQRPYGGACDGASHRVHERVDVFGLLWAWQWHGPWQTLQDTMVWAHESCQRGVVCFPPGGLLQMSHLARLLCCALRFAGGQRHLQRESCKSSTSSFSHLAPCSPLHSSLEHGAGRGHRQLHGVSLTRVDLLAPLLWLCECSSSRRWVENSEPLRSWANK